MCMVYNMIHNFDLIKTALYPQDFLIEMNNHTVWPLNECPKNFPDLGRNKQQNQ